MAAVDSAALVARAAVLPAVRRVERRDAVARRVLAAPRAAVLRWVRFPARARAVPVRVRVRLLVAVVLVPVDPAPRVLALAVLAVVPAVPAEPLPSRR